MPFRALLVAGAVAGPLAALAACASPGTPTTASTAPVSFKQDVAPLLSQTCAGCHTPSGMGASSVALFDAGGGVVYANVKAEISEIVRAVERGRMPARGAKLTSEQIGVLTRWQAAGSPDN